MSDASLVKKIFQYLKKNSDRPTPTWASNTFGIIQETLKGNFNISDKGEVDQIEIVNPKRVLTKGFEE